MNQASEILRTRNLKVTKGREAMLRLFLANGKPLSISFISNSLDFLDRITIYRILHKLLDNGIINKTSVDTNEIYYDLCNTNCQGHHHQHIHFKCRVCGNVESISVSRKIDLGISLHSVESLDVIASGVCFNCTSKDLYYSIDK